MIGTIDKAGRVVIPQELRGQVGFTPGPVQITVLGNTIQLEQAGSRLRQVDGHLLLPLGEPSLDDDAIRELRLADQR